jgi:hypothetical protein
MPSFCLAPQAAAYYAAHSVFSDPGAFAGRYAGLPADPARLAATVRGLMVHRLEGELFRYQIPDDRLCNDAESRYTDEILRIILQRNDAPLTQRRWVGDRFVGICRDFALLFCSFLRHAGIPARLRIGFADYFGTDGFHGDHFHGDHVVTEYWDERQARWLLGDAELADPALLDAHRIPFDPLDVPRDRFLVAGEAWRRIRAGELDARRCGLRLPSRSLVGEGFVAGNVRLDLSALNRTEMLQWDLWGIGADADSGMTDEIRALYDEAARVSGDEVPFEEARRLFEQSDALRTPATVRSEAPFLGPRQVTLRRAI